MISSDKFAAAYGLGDNDAVIVRPDGLVAWRAKVIASDPDRRSFAFVVLELQSDKFVDTECVTYMLVGIPRAFRINRIARLTHAPCGGTHIAPRATSIP